MKLLLDTHVVLWWLDDPNLLREDTVFALVEPENEVFVSSVVAWEIALKRSLRKLEAPENLWSYVLECGFSELPISTSHAFATELLPFHHRDPFDRMLIAQARHEEMTLVTRDSKIARYDVSVMEA